MACTRFHNDPARIRKQNEIYTYQSRYTLDAPGPGVNSPFVEDPHIRLTKWGANNCSQSTDIESDLRGIGPGKQLSHNTANYRDVMAPVSQKQYSSTPSFVEDTRISQPAWLLRDVEFNQWKNPQPAVVPITNTDFQDSISSYTRNNRFI
jgi:hypothetical protein